MTQPLWDVARTVRARVGRFFDAPPPADARPLELLQAALDQLERQTQPSGRGSRVFPYSRVVVHIAQPHADRAAIDAVFGRLEARLRERLAEIHCEAPRSLVASAVVTEPAGSDTPLLRVECSRDSQNERLPVSPAVPDLHVVVLKGQCDRADYSFSGGVVAIGRGAEPVDAAGRVRRNAIAFLDVRDEVSETVARAHARIEFDPALRAYVVFNESSSNPTFIVRRGRTLRIDPRDPRGVRLESDDELQIGRAVLKIGVVEAAPAAALS
jgi:hypothetical protein